MKKKIAPLQFRRLTLTLRLSDGRLEVTVYEYIVSYQSTVVTGFKGPIFARGMVLPPARSILSKPVTKSVQDRTECTP